MGFTGSVLQASAWYPPYHTGGTEVYLNGLVHSLRDKGVKSTVLTPRADGAANTYEHEGAAVATYPPLVAGQADSYGSFESLVRRSPATVYNQHSWTPDCGAWHLAAARRAGKRTVLTVHVPSNLCMRGTMMRAGQAACDGKVEQRRCAACWLQSRGAPAPLADAIAALPGAGLVGRLAPGRIGTALTGRDLARSRMHDIASMVENADHIVAVCQWLYDALLLNGAPASKLSLCRQGVSTNFLRSAGMITPSATWDGPLRLLFLGRWHPVKGIDVLVRAIRAAPDLAVRLTIHAVGAGPEEEAYRREVIRLMGDDSRFLVGAPLAREQIVEVMASHDMLAVPSVWLETGPLVVLEAQAAGLAVIGSNLGGIAELVDQPEDGVLVQAGDVQAWTSALRTVAATARRRLMPERRAVRSMATVADEMIEIYAAA